MGGPDLLKIPFEPALSALRDALTGHGMPPAQVGAATDLVDVAGVAVVGAAVAPIAARLYANAAARVAGVRSTAADAPLLLAGLAACVLLLWIVLHPATQIEELFIRWDHVAFSALAGGVLAAAPPNARAWALGLLSIAFMWQYGGHAATPIVLGASLAGFAALGSRTVGRGAGAVLSLGLLGATIYAVSCLFWHSALSLEALQTFGLFSFLFLRQISAAVALAGSARPTLGSYLCYLTFYPGAFGLVGGPEVYADFSRRNLAGRLHYDPRAAVRGVAWGALQIWLAYRVPISLATMYESGSMLAAWESSLLLFLRAALYGMGLWSMVDATALFHGFRLHPNFRGILTRQNPSELWWAWRGTFTNWLVRHVYAPLGANQRHQALNILAAFAVSWLWHVLGTPFLSKQFRPLQLAPITLWATVNAVAVIGHIEFRRRGLRLLPRATPPLLRRAIHIFLTACLGTFAVTFLLLQGDLIDRFVPFLRVLVGLGR
jgi:hypothetical protein